jgi:hypothetical protein
MEKKKTTSKNKPRKKRRGNFQHKTPLSIVFIVEPTPPSDIVELRSVEIQERYVDGHFERSAIHRIIERIRTRIPEFDDGSAR